MYKVDLHSHSILSRDGGISKFQYKDLFERRILDVIAITDHDEISFAQAMHNDFGDKIIVGQEINTDEGEIIGLYLKKRIASGLSLVDSVHEIKAQDGLIYIPHPFETFRSGLKVSSLMKILNDLDIIEIFNARGVFRHKETESKNFRNKYNLSGAASSDAHCMFGIGTAFSIIDKMPNVKTLKKLLIDASYRTDYAPSISYLCPSINRIRGIFKKNDKFK